MPVKVVIPTPLRAYTGKQESVQLQAATVGEALSALTSQFADLKKHLFNEEGRLRSFVNVYVNDEDIRYLQRDQTPVREDDVVSIVPSIAGGATRPATVPEITPRELKSRLDRGDDIYILDVREPHEYQVCNIGGHLIPLGELSSRVNELDRSREIVAHCRGGKRSAEASELLRKAGFRNIWNLKGGILAWSREVDPSLPT
jgi:rhodanese-related sulfurtransferase/molybdopterin converting factor small subunit